MKSDYSIDTQSVLETTSDIISAYVMRNKISTDELCTSIGDIYSQVFEISRSHKALTYKDLLNGGEGVL